MLKPEEYCDHEDVLVNVLPLKDRKTEYFKVNYFIHHTDNNIIIVVLWGRVEKGEAVVRSQRSTPSNELLGTIIVKVTGSSMMESIKDVTHFVSFKSPPLPFKKLIVTDIQNV